MKRIGNSFFAAARLAALSSTSLALGLPATAYAQGAEEAQPATDAPAAEEVGNGNDIVVTATKREQTLQDVPIAVSVTTAQTIERANIRDLKDLATVVPSLRVSEHQTSTQTDFIIRGFGNGANNAGIEPSVGVFVDGVYRSRSAAQITDLPDIQRVEVLRGPQSTLFGKNASAGVVSIVTQKPKFTFGGNFEASYGNYNALVIKGVVTGPLSETVAASLAAGYNRRDGFILNPVTGGKINDRDRWFVRGQLLFQPSEGLSVRLIGDYSKVKEICCAAESVQVGARTGILTNPLGIGGKVNNPADPFGGLFYANFDPTNSVENYGLSGQIDYEVGPMTLTSITAYRESKTLANFDTDFTSADLLRGAGIGRLDVKTFTQELRLQANFVDRVNVLLGGFYFHENVDQGSSVSYAPAARPFFDTLIRGAGLSVATLEGTFGALEGNPAKYIGQFFATGQNFVETDKLNDNNFSIFSQVDFKVTDRLTLTGGINYTNDKKRFSDSIVTNDVFAGLNFNALQYAPFRNTLLYQGALSSQVGAALGLGRSATAAEIGAFATSSAANNAVYNAIDAGSHAFANASQNCITVGNPTGCTVGNPLNALSPLQLFAPFLAIPNAVEPGKTSDDKFTYTARLAFDATEHINVYVSFATGYKASSVNLSRDSRPLLSDKGAIESAGIAVVNQTYGGRFAGPESSTVYEAGIKASWRNASVNIAVFDQKIKGFQANSFTGLGFILSNAGQQSVRGFEIEGMFKPVPELTISGGLTYLDPKYDTYLLSPLGNASGTRPAQIPTVSFSIGAEYNHELGNQDHIIAHVGFHHESKTQVLEGLPAFIVTNANGSLNYQPAIDAAKPFTREVNELDSSLTYAMHNGIELSIWGRNLTDNRYITAIFDSPAQAGSVSAYPNTPRTFGGSVRYRF
ncbi:MAG: TonB-dependent receptor [Novosphingobium sp.]